MTKPYVNVCIRCGKPRIEVKTWKEKSPSGLVTHTTMTCPDPECQKKVNQLFADQKVRRDQIEKDRQERKDVLKKSNLQKRNAKAAGKK